jgi:folate-binding protein YgfZ
MRPDVPVLLDSGDAFADLGSWRVIAVSGSDAVDWLNDIVSADVSDLEPGRSRRALLLSRTGSIRATFTAAARDGDLLLIQDPEQHSIADLLAPYVLSSDVVLEDRSDSLALFALPGRERPLDAPSATHSSPSCLGSGAGIDLIVSLGDRGELSRRLAERLTQADTEELEAWRILRGSPRLGLDVFDGDLPQEAGLDAAVSRGKGCYVGQEAVAKLDNLGHPRRLVVRFEADAPVSAGDAVLVGTEDAGRVTSVLTMDGETHGIGRVRWDARDGSLRTAAGVAVRTLGR